MHPQAPQSFSFHCGQTASVSVSSSSAIAGPSSCTSPNLGDCPSDAIVPLKYTSEEEIQAICEAAAGFTACLAADHDAIMHPDVDTPFTDAADVVNRLLPYHIFQQPQDDLRALTQSRRYKGKEKVDCSELRQEIEDTRFALSCHKRLKKLQGRFRRAQLNAGKRASPDGQVYALLNAMLEVERTETAVVSSTLRSARNELDAIHREKRLASQPTVSTFRSTYYPHQSQHYRPYAYAYTHPYNHSGPGPTTSTLYTTPTTTLSTPASGTMTSPNAASYTPSGVPIPVQLPVTSLSALHALGIVPVPTASLPPPDQPQPAAVLKGSTSNGTMLSLDINVSLLQSSQMSGLALLLNSLMSKGVSPGQPGVAPAGSLEKAIAGTKS
ncbi:hypothetical protein V8B97DRAFT_1271461 [Scleroderma yunnanense]